MDTARVLVPMLVNVGTLLMMVRAVLFTDAAPQAAEVKRNQSPAATAGTRSSD